MRKIILIFILISLSCDSTMEMQREEGDCVMPQDVETVKDNRTYSEWLCWNPSSPHHGGPCVEACMIPGNQNTFCYQSGPPSSDILDQSLRD